VRERTRLGLTFSFGFTAAAVYVGGQDAGGVTLALAFPVSPAFAGFALGGGAWAEGRVVGGCWT